MLLSSDADKLREARCTITRCTIRGRASATVGGKRLEYHDVNRQSLGMKSHDVPRTCFVIPSRIVPVVPLDFHGTTNRVALPNWPYQESMGDAAVLLVADSTISIPSSGHNGGVHAHL